MRGTLDEGDRLGICAVPVESLQRGDIVAFRSSGQVMAHRIIGCEDGRFQTQGDGNWRRDSSLLDPADVIGRVAERERDGERAAVVGGPRGQRRAVFAHALAFLRWSFFVLLAPFYRLIRASRVSVWLWHPRIVRVRFAGPGGICTKFIHRARIVARWSPGDRRWTCRKPYDLILFPPEL